MSARTKKRPIRKKPNLKNKQSSRKNVAWREAAKSELKKHSEPGQMLRGCRHKERLTQNELAIALEMSQHHISEMENGKRSIGKVIAKRFAAFFNIDYRVFL
ncbi:helix-turn-helix transcriptional regulator [Simkania negevensis]|uniref:Plasmid maintenance system antidote protein, XRE family n=1 Tax=Simkania negevensis (strain ATCC VR-1471 / DSM 27360 / Z) TaxID=331113 RepID=F8L8R3_SIMNZ|nr:helix-turn-helix transcriptional regulator [Simkania negevensis]MCB1075147.1 helix-turn-helix transcriptional regulator [Simkania sp.]CCB89206.1 plasmid maintenance system antidote protein, XRE family [Simkania negevensis Z]